MEEFENINDSCQGIRPTLTNLYQFNVIINKSYVCAKSTEMFSDTPDQRNTSKAFKSTAL